MDIALQLYSLKEYQEKNFEEALAMTAKAGYQGVEFAGYCGKTADDMKGLLQKYKLKPVSSHVSLKQLQEQFIQEAEYAQALGYRLIVCPNSTCKTKTQVLEDARFLESCAQTAAPYGITIGYHNHAHEFRRFDGEYALDILLNAAPSLQFQPDVYWIVSGGIDPVEYIAPWARAGRICAVHAKDMAKKTDETVSIGYGRIDFHAIAQLCPPTDYPWIVEQEQFAGDPAESIAQSCRGLRKVFDRLAKPAK